MRPDGGIEAGDVLLGKYQIESLLGRGGMGLVYRARHLQLRELVAIKVLRADVQLDPEAVTRFKREAQAAVRSGSAKRPTRKLAKRAAPSTTGSADESVWVAPPPPPPDAAENKCNVWESRTGCR